MVEIKAKLKPFMPFLLKANELWLVGGAIRDAILGLPVKDFDFVIKNRASEFAKWVAQTLNATFILLDGRTDEARVVYKTQEELIFDFTSMESIEKDLARRDFRLNAIAAKLPEFKIFDPFNGLRDIENKRIRMIAEQSFIDDPLRILRAFRFSAVLGFKIEHKTLKALGTYKIGIKNVAPERLHEELFELLGAKRSYPAMRQMAKLGILQAIIPEIGTMERIPQGKPGGNLLDHSLLTVKKVESLLGSQDSTLRQFQSLTNSQLLKLGALLHDIGKPYCYSEGGEDGEVHFYGHEEKGVELLECIRESLRLSNYELKVLQSLIRYHMRPHLLASEKSPTNKAICKLIKAGGDDTPAILLLAYADALASGGRGRKRLLDLLVRGLSLWEETRRPKFKRLLTGDDLIELGLKPGPIFREILDKVEELQVSGELQTREQAIEFVKINFR